MRRMCRITRDLRSFAIDQNSLRRQVAFNTLLLKQGSVEVVVKLSREKPRPVAQRRTEKRRRSEVGLVQTAVPNFYTNGQLSRKSFRSLCSLQPFQVSRTTY